MVLAATTRDKNSLRFDEACAIGFGFSVFFSLHPKASTEKFHLRRFAIWTDGNAARRRKGMKNPRRGRLIHRIGTADSPLMESRIVGAPDANKHRARGGLSLGRIKCVSMAMGVLSSLKPPHSSRRFNYDRNLWASRVARGVKRQEQRSQVQEIHKERVRCGHELLIRRTINSLARIGCRPIPAAPPEGNIGS